MPNIKKIRDVISKLAGYNSLGKNLCFFGGVMPYITADTDSYREHSDIDILVLKDHMPFLREALKELGVYNSKHDSMCLGLDKDYGIKAFINGVYVEFEPMEVRDNKLYRRSFSETRKIAGEEITPFEKITDLIVPVEIDGVRTYSMSNEYIKVQKEKYRRPKDIADINFIDSQGIDGEKYRRVMYSFKNREETLVDYSNKSNEIKTDGEIAE